MPEHAREQYNPQYTDFKQAMASPRFSELRDLTQSYIQGLAAQADSLLARLGVDRLEDYDERQVRTEEQGEQLLAELDLYMELFSHVLEAMEKDRPIYNVEKTEKGIQYRQGEDVAQIISIKEGLFSITKQIDGSGSGVFTLYGQEGLKTIDGVDNFEGYRTSEGKIIFLFQNKESKWIAFNEKLEMLSNTMGIKEPVVIESEGKLYFVVESTSDEEKELYNEHLELEVSGLDVTIQDGIMYSAFESTGGRNQGFLSPGDIELEGYREGCSPKPHFVDYNGRKVLVHQDEENDELRIISLAGELIGIVDTLSPVQSIHDYKDGSLLVVAYDDEYDNESEFYSVTKDGSQEIVSYSGKVSELIVNKTGYLVKIGSDQGAMIYNSKNESVAEDSATGALVEFGEQLLIEHLPGGKVEAYYDENGSWIEFPDFSKIEKAFEVDGKEYAWVFSGRYYLFDPETHRSITSCYYEEIKSADTFTVRDRGHVYVPVQRRDLSWCFVDELGGEHGSFHEPINVKVFVEGVVEVAYTRNPTDEEFEKQKAETGIEINDIIGVEYIYLD
jgi:hypothetical protein